MEYKIIEDYITPNKYSRPQKDLKRIKALVIHWVANPNTSAIANRNFFESRKGGEKSYGSAHEIIDLNGDVVIVIPENEMAYHVGSKTYTDEALVSLSDYPNDCTYGIECTHVDWQGNMTDETIATLIARCADLCTRYDLDPLVDIWTHKQVVGWKNCPKYFVDHPKEFELFKEKVKIKMTSVNTSDSWKYELGKEALVYLADKKIIDSPKIWIDKLDEPVPNWLFFTIVERIIKQRDCDKN